MLWDDIDYKINEVWNYNENQKYGVINYKNKILVKADYSKIISDISDEFIVVMKGNLYGVIDINENIIVPFNYEYMYPFHDNIAAVVKNNMYEFINSNNEIILDFKYENAESFRWDNGQSRDYTIAFPVFKYVYPKDTVEYNEYKTVHEFIILQYEVINKLGETIYQSPILKTTNYPSELLTPQGYKEFLLQDIPFEQINLENYKNIIGFDYTYKIEEFKYEIFIFKEVDSLTEFTFNNLD